MVKKQNIVPLFPNDEGNCAYIDIDRLIKETFSNDFIFKMIAVAMIGQEKDPIKQQEMLKRLVGACKNQQEYNKKSDN